MKCPFRIQMCCSLLGNSESSEGGRVQSGGFSWYCHSYQMCLSLTHAHAHHTLRSRFFFLRKQDLAQQHAAGLGTVDASGLSPPLPGSTLLVLAVITGSASGTAAGNKTASCYQESHTFIATFINMLLMAQIIWGSVLSWLWHDCHFRCHKKKKRKNKNQ